MSEGRRRGLAPSMWLLPMTIDELGDCLIDFICDPIFIGLEGVFVPRPFEDLPVVGGSDVETREIDDLQREGDSNLNLEHAVAILGLIQ